VEEPDPILNHAWGIGDSIQVDRPLGADLGDRCGRGNGEPEARGLERLGADDAQPERRRGRSVVARRLMGIDPFVVPADERHADHGFRGAFLNEPATGRDGDGDEKEEEEAHFLFFFFFVFVFVSLFLCVSPALNDFFFSEKKRLDGIRSFILHKTKQKKKKKKTRCHDY
jgi:hypothetical protein